MTKSTKEQVLHIADMARLELKEEEIEGQVTYMEEMITLATVLDKLNTDDVAQTTHVFQQRNVMREDVVDKKYSREDILKNVPDHQDGQIKVPTILE
jgi:aspartyl-tRNA(Asn)/glutamyl-tRNA(Gln) amidotransferase subunit C